MRFLLGFFIACCTLLCSDVSVDCPGIDACFVVLNDVNEASPVFKEGTHINEWKCFRYQELPQDLVMKYCSYNMSPYLLAQVLGHLSLYRYCLEQDMQSVLVVESKACQVAPLDSVSQLVASLDCYDPSWDILYTDRDYHNPQNGEIIAPNWNDESVNKQKINAHFSKLHSRYGTVSFVISKRGMKKIISHLENKWYDLPYDQALFNIPSMCIYGSNIDLITNCYETDVPKIPDLDQVKYKVGSRFCINANELLTASRFDVMAKYIYAKYYLEGYNTEWHLNLYKTHLKKWCNFYEARPLKIGFQDFQDAFHNLLDSLQNKGYQTLKDCMPIHSTGSICNGAHRTAGSLVLGLRPYVEVTGNEPSPVISFSWIRQMHGLDEKYLDHMAYQYALLKKNVHMVCFPVLCDSAEIVQSKMEQYGGVVFQKEAFFNACGTRALMHLFYPDQEIYQDTVGTYYIYLFECEKRNIEEMRQAICAQYQIPDDQFHVTTSRDSTLQVAASLFNQNSIDFMNQVVDFSVFIKHLNTLEANEGAIYDSTQFKRLETVPASHAHIKHMDDMLFNPDHHFYYMGVKLLSPLD